MLEPDTRELLLDALRPPEGCGLVHAVGTTYSMDLDALLFAPLAFAMFDWAVDEDGQPSPIALLEALRRHADRTTVFCQAGQIGLPRDYQPLLTYLEPGVVPVTAPNPDFIFHPKLWVLRFRPEDGEPDRYRLLCLTRNLTFDTSWDTACVLEGQRRAGGDTISQNRPLRAFLLELADRSERIDPVRRTAILDLADDVANVRFEAPDGFDSVRFHPLGLADRGWPFLAEPDRTLVVSPFLTSGALSRMASGSVDDVLVSRQEALDGLGRSAIEDYPATYVLSQAVDQPDALAGLEDDAEVDGHAKPALSEAHGEAVDSELRGLHAKLVVMEGPNDVRFYTGSANATDAAFGGNVEFVVELRTRQDEIGIDRLLAFEEGVTTLRNLLEEYTPPDRSEPVDRDAWRVEHVLDRVRRRVGALALTATLSDGDGDGFGLELTSVVGVELPEEVTSVHCWPITRGQGHQVTPRLGPDGLTAAFGRISEEGITSFFAFEVVARSGSTEDRAKFVVNVELVGAPEGRAERVIAQILSSRQDVLRYLLFLLADTAGNYSALADFLTVFGGEPGTGSWRVDVEPPLFETLVRAIAKDPSRLDHIHGLVRDLEESGRADELIPEGFREVWDPVWQAREELRT